MSAVDGMKVSNYQRPVNLLEIASRGKPEIKKAAGQEATFEQALSRELSESHPVTFSKHASERLYSRGIELGSEQLEQIATAVDKAQTKGSRETLVLTDEAALVVSVKNRTVITVFDRGHLRNGVVTSIDSAVII